MVFFFSMSRAESARYLGATLCFDQVTCQLWFVAGLSYPLWVFVVDFKITYK